VSSSIKIAEIFAALGVRLEPGSVARVDKFLDENVDKAARSSGKIGKHIGKALGDMRRAIAPAVAGLAAGIGYAAVRGVDDALKFGEAVTTLKIAASGAMGSSEEMSQRFLDLSRSSGIAKEELVVSAHQKPRKFEPAGRRG
jgi:hypothetical protein